MACSVHIHKFGDADVLRIEGVAIGESGVGEAHLGNHATGPNRTDVTVRAGRSPVKPILPSNIGFDAAGARRLVARLLNSPKP